jgi:chemotaxis methyl-accepting protein methylase
MILCCNVLIYFNAAYQEIIFNNLYRALDAQGFLVLGETEVPLGRHAGIFKRKNECCHVYQKSG